MKTLIYSENDYFIKDSINSLSQQLKDKSSISTSFSEFYAELPTLESNDVVVIDCTEGPIQRHNDIDLLLSIKKDIAIIMVVEDNDLRGSRSSCAIEQGVALVIARSYLKSNLMMLIALSQKESGIILGKKLTHDNSNTRNIDTLVNRNKKLSPREKQVAKKIAEGLPNNTIATELNISESTVKKHATSIFSTLKIKSRYQLPMAFYG